MGHIISQEGIFVDPKKVKTIMERPIPKNFVDIRYFMGLVGYYYYFIKGFSRIYYPITSLQKKGKAFKCIVECQYSFE